jgi:hypothetical protein
MNGIVTWTKRISILIGWGDEVTTANSYLKLVPHLNTPSRLAVSRERIPPHCQSRSPAYKKERLIEEPFLLGRDQRQTALTSEDSSFISTPQLWIQTKFHRILKKAQDGYNVIIKIQDFLG